MKDNLIDLVLAKDIFLDDAMQRINNSPSSTDVLALMGCTLEEARMWARSPGRSTFATIVAQRRNAHSPSFLLEDLSQTMVDYLIAYQLRLVGPGVPQVLYPLGDKGRVTDVLDAEGLYQLRNNQMWSPTRCVTEAGLLQKLGVGFYQESPQGPRAWRGYVGVPGQMEVSAASPMLASARAAIKKFYGDAMFPMQLFVW